jgi:hypothetical protein
MTSSGSPASKPGPWISLWVGAGISLLFQLGLCQFFSFGQNVPESLDVNPSNLWKLAYHFPPTGSFQVLNWLGVAYLPQALNPLSLAAHLPPWLFFTAYAPVMSTCALLAMAAFLREMELSRPAALFGGVIYAWQGDILPFVYPGHYGYITSWPFFAMAAWGALRAQRTGHWAYAVISGACCGTMVSLLTNADRGGIASLLIGALYLAPMFRPSPQRATQWRNLLLCLAVAAVIALAQVLALYKSNIANVKLAGTTTREEAYKTVTQFSLGPAETLSYLVPGFFGWHINNPDGPYWGWIGEWPDYPKKHQGTRNLNLGISTTGTIATVLALIGMGLLLPGNLFGPVLLPERQRFYGRLLLGLGFVALVLSWGWHTGFYRPLFALPLMDKWRNPLKWIELTDFALVVLSAIGLQHLIASLNASLPGLNIVRRRIGWFCNIMVALLGLGWMAGYLLSMVLRPALQNEGYDQLSVVNVIDTMHRSILVAFFLMVVFSVKLRALWHADWWRTFTLVNPWLQRIWQRMLQTEETPLTLALIMSTLAILQLGWVATQFIDPEPIRFFTDSNPLLDALHREGNTVRVSVETGDPLLQSLLQNQFAAQGISSLDISAASRIPDDLNTFLKTFEDNRSRLWFLAGVKNVAVPADMMTQMQQDPAMAPNIKNGDGYTLIPTDSPDMPSHALVGMRDYLAKATLVPKDENFQSDEELLKRLKDPAWNPRESVLINEANPGQKLPIPKFPPMLDQLKAFRPGAYNVELKTYTPTEIEIEAHLDHGGYVLINDQYDPDWQVQVDGQPAELLRADYIMRAVKVSPGDATITMRYAAHYHIAGLNLPAKAVNDLSDGAMIAAWLVAGFALRRRSFNDAANPLASLP